MTPSTSCAHKLGYSWDDYRSWPDDERWELIGGEAFAMSPAPSTRHQTVALNFGVMLKSALAGKKPCTPFLAPVDVKLSEQDVVQPDLLVEVLSPHTSARDLREKKALYERAGVKEYLVVDPLEHYAIRFLNGPDGFDKGQVFGADERLIVATLEALEIPLWEVFELPAPEVSSA
jgi:Uma2 family endonuclease